jgi:hypothetical protein
MRGIIQVVDTRSGEHWKIRPSSTRSTLICDARCCLAFSVDGAKIIVADRYGTISCWDSFSGRFLGDGPTTTDLIDMPVGLEPAQWLARANGVEIEIISASDQATVTWYPSTLSDPNLRRVAASPDLRSWAVIRDIDASTLELVRLKIDGKD